MTENNAKAMASYIYLKFELKRIAAEKSLTDEQIKQIEASLKNKLGITKDLCWI